MIFGVWETPTNFLRLPKFGKFFSTPNAYIIIVILITGAKVMTVLSFAKNKFPKFLYLSKFSHTKCFWYFSHKIWIKRNYHTKN